MLGFLPPRLRDAVRHVNLDLLYELRVRAGRPLRANLGGSFCFLGEHGEGSEREALLPTASEVEDTLFAASGYCVYAVENQIRRGFVTAEGGVRIGIAGSYVYDGKNVLTVRDVTSLCIRIPHEVRGCAEEVYSRCFSGGICPTAILSPPGEGKTTLLRDLTRLISERTLLNILVSDERGELSAGELGGTADIVRFAEKHTAFAAGIRAMRPDLIVTDELLPEDYAAVRRALESGVCVLASAHLTRFEDVPEKLFFRYVLLKGLGNVDRILDQDGNHVA